MRNSLLAAAVAFVIGGATVGSLMSYAQPVPPPGTGCWPGHGRPGGAASRADGADGLDARLA